MNWTSEQDAKLRKLYPTVSVDELAERFGVAPSIVYYRALKLGLKKKSKKAGTPTITSKVDIAMWAIYNQAYILQFMRSKYYFESSGDMQDVFLEAIYKLTKDKSEFKPIGKPTGVFWSAINQTMCDYSRKKRANLTLNNTNEQGHSFGDALKSDIDIDADIDNADRRQHLQYLIAQCKFNHAEKEVLKYILMGHNLPEISDETGIAYGTVKVSFFKIKNKILQKNVELSSLKIAI